MLLLLLSWFLTCNGTKWPKLCLCAVKKLLTHPNKPHTAKSGRNHVTAGARWWRPISDRAPRCRLSLGFSGRCFWQLYKIKYGRKL